MSDKREEWWRLVRAVPEEQVQRTLAEILAKVKSGGARRMIAAADVSGYDPTSQAETGGAEVLAWGVVANVSRDLVRYFDDQRRPGTRHFVPGAKVWVFPILWGDGGEQRYVIGTRRQSGGKKLIRVVMPSDRLVNFRLKPVYSPAVYRMMTKDWDTQPEPVADATVRTPPGLYESRQDAEDSVQWHEWVQTRRVHFMPESWDRMHRADQACEFCDGLDAYRAGAPLDDNPHGEPDAPKGTIGWRESPHGFWAAGWRSEAHLAGRETDDDLAIHLLVAQRRRLRASAAHLAGQVRGKSAADIEAQELTHSGDARLRFVHGNYEPRALDGIVHAWVDANGVVVRTQFS